MDLLASILAYLGTVAMIVLAVAMSFDAFVYTPLHSINAQHTKTVEAKTTVPKAIVAKAAEAKPNAAKVLSTASADKKIASARVPVAARSHSALKAASQMDIAAERRAAYLRREARQKRLRRLARQAGASEWASQQAPNALGYANEPPEGLYNAFPYQ